MAAIFIDEKSDSESESNSASDDDDEKSDSESESNSAPDDDDEEEENEIDGVESVTPETNNTTASQNYTVQSGNCFELLRIHHHLHIPHKNSSDIVNFVRSHLSGRILSKYV